jgi:hypothetical protein
VIAGSTYELPGSGGDRNIDAIQAKTEKAMTDSAIG